MKHTILHQDAAAAAAFEDALRHCRERIGRWQTAQRRYGVGSPQAIEAATRWRDVASDLSRAILAAAVVSSDELDHAEAMLHGMRFAVPQDEMGS